jgi:hypothetical protein
MSWNLQTFRKNIKAIALNQYFQVTIPELDSEDRLTALARTTELPAMTHENTGIPYRGLDMKIQTKVSFNDWNVTFLCEQDHDLRTKVLRWQSSMYNLDNASNYAHDDYKYDGVEIAKIGYDGKVSPETKCTFYGLFPTSVGAVSLDQAGGSPDTFDVTFTYDFFLPADGKLEGWKGAAQGQG